MSETKNFSDIELRITSDPIARGKERTCFLHPQDATKIIKISSGDIDIQSRREIDFYERLKRTNLSDYRHLPRYYGTVQTNLGRGIVLDLIRDADGRVSSSLLWHLERGFPLTEAEDQLRSLKQYLLDNLIIFNHDLFAGNLLLQKIDDGSSRLVVIDGLGDVVSIAWLNRFPSHVRSKINRRWERLLTRFYNNEHVIAQQKQTR